MPATTIDTQEAFNAIWGESISYTQVNGTVTAFTACQYPDEDAEGITSYGVYTVKRERWTFASDAITGDARVRDTIAFGGVTRVVTRVSGSPFLKFWRVETAYPALAAELDQTATVSRANPVSDSLGLREPLPVVVYEDVPCRLQPVSRVRELDSAARVVTEQTFTCVFGSAVTLAAGDTVTVDSVIYEVTEQSVVEELGVLTFAAVMRID